LRGGGRGAADWPGGPGRGAGDGGLEVLGEAAAAAKPGEATLDHPSPRQELEAFDRWRAGDDLDGPGAAVRDRVVQLRAAVDAVGKDMVQLRESLAQRAQQQHRTMRVLAVGLMHQHGEQEVLCIGDDMALAPFDALAGIDPARAAAFGGGCALASRRVLT
jgi:hypothetical protein